MTRLHLAFCQPGTNFYDRGRGDQLGTVFPALSGKVENGWRRHSDAEWIHLVPQDVELKGQGWKIHVSATPENCARLLEVTMAYCSLHYLPFKALAGPDYLRRRNAKDGDRSASGKFVTIYPPDDAAVEKTLRELGEELDGEVAPYILSDLRWRSGPLYVRYGAFVTEIVEGEKGRAIYCIRDPEGNLVEDRRGPSFRVPEWVTIPGFLDEAMQARADGRLTHFPYNVHGALAYSNGGGVYRATHLETGEAVLLKEARPYSGIDDQGRDAVERQSTELWATEALEGLPSSARLIERVRGHEHQFLVREFVAGDPLMVAVAKRHPLGGGNRGVMSAAQYAQWALRILVEIERGINDMHARGVVFGDFHPGNILVSDDDTITFIDLETATPVEQNAAQVIAAPGFRAPASYRGVDADRFALACIKVAVFAPEAPIAFLWDTGKIDDVLEFIRSEFLVPSSFEDSVRHDLGDVSSAVPEAQRGWKVPEFSSATWDRLRAQMVRWIVATATPDRDDRLYPGDIVQFARPGAGLGLMHGAAGVLLALTEAGERPDSHIAWWLDHIQSAEAITTGFHDGLAGIAYALEMLGEEERARDLSDQLSRRDLDGLDTGLASGLAGVGLVLSWFGQRTGDSRFNDRAMALVERILARPAATASPPGLLDGASGRALFFLSLYEKTGERSLLDHARSAIRKDLAAFGYLDDESSPQRTGRYRDRGRTSTIAGDGGTALVLDRLLGHEPNDELAMLRDDIVRRCSDVFSAWPGLLRGRIGALHITHTIEPRLGNRHGGEMRLGTLAFPEGLASFGDGLLRLSNDLGTGAAGILAVGEHVWGGKQGGKLPLHLYGTGDTSPASHPSSGGLR